MYAAADEVGHVLAGLEHAEERDVGLPTEPQAEADVFLLLLAGRGMRGFDQLRRRRGLLRRRLLAGGLRHNRDSGQ